MANGLTRRTDSAETVLPEMPFRSEMARVADPGCSLTLAPVSFRAAVSSVLIHELRREATPPEPVGRAAGRPTQCRRSRPARLTDGRPRQR